VLQHRCRYVIRRIDVVERHRQLVEAGRHRGTRDNEGCT
jgi:hypothetical protein